MNNQPVNDPEHRIVNQADKENSWLECNLQERKEKGLYRSSRIFPGAGDTQAWIKTKIFNFSSNDYLNLSKNDSVLKYTSEAIARWGSGSGGSRLMCGTTEIHHKLEEQLALLMGTESALVFGSGFLANIGLLTSLAGKGDVIYSDKLNHASLVDGVRFSGAESKRYRHKDPGHLEKMLRSDRDGRRRFIVTDSVFSMDGDVAPLEAISSLAHQYGASLIVDEAHGVGVFGCKGGGILESLNIAPPLAICGTLSKSFGGYGGFIACSNKLREYLVNNARSFIYSTALPPACVASALGALEYLKDRPDYGTALLEKADFFYSLLKKSGLPVGPRESQIIPLIVGDNRKTMELSEKLREYNIIAVAVRPPTVPEGTARLRFSITMDHSKEDLELCAGVIIREMRLLERLPQDKVLHERIPHKRIQHKRIQHKRIQHKRRAIDG